MLQADSKKDEKTQGLYKINHLWNVKTELCGTKRINISTKRVHLSPPEQWSLFQDIVSSYIVRNKGGYILNSINMFQ